EHFRGTALAIRLCNEPVRDSSPPVDLTSALVSALLVSAGSSAASVVVVVSAPPPQPAMNKSRIMARAVPLKCSWDFTMEGESASGTVYVKGDKFRSEVLVSGETAYSMSDGTHMYSWSTMQADGMKFRMDSFEEPETKQDIGDFKESGSDAQDLNTEYDYKCTPWVVSSSKFVPPGDVKFADMTETMQQMAEMGSGGDMGGMEDFDVCGMCDMIPEGPDRDDCLAEC
ncbi:hypothetical protein ACFL96_09170, partial [Thermoproteota archaeon]